MIDLSERQKVILTLVIHEYTRTATPVGSQTLVERYKLDMSSATVRNELAALTERGYLRQPHTSAGRVPTEAGYRFFVEHLMGEARLPEAEELMIRHQFHQTGLDLDQWARLAAAVLSHTARGAALVTAPHVSGCRFKHLELIAIRDTVILLVLVLQEGIVTQRMLSLTQAETQENLARVTNKFNDQFAGLPAEKVADTPPITDLFEASIRQIIVDLMLENDRETMVEVYSDGLAHVLGEPEFTDSKMGRQVVRVLEEHRLLGIISREVLEAGGVHVIIGGEGRWEDLSDFSVVLSRYGWSSRVTGLLGVLGPMRMPYGRAISSVRYVSEVLSELVRNLYAGDQETVDVS